MRRKPLVVRSVVAMATAGVVVLGASAADAGLAQPHLVSSTPVSYTPHMKVGYVVHEQAVVGSLVFVGGQFSSFENSARTVTYPRQNFVAYNKDTGAVSPLVLNFDGDVLAMAANSTGSALYIGGKFTHVNGSSRPGLVKLNIGSGTLDSTFKWPGGSVYALGYSGSYLYVGGSFAKRLVAVSPTTGADTGRINLNVSGSLGVQAGPTRVAKLAVNPAGNDLVAIGNFTTVNGQSRKSAFRANVGTAPATLANWHPQRFNVRCASDIPYYVRDVAWSPDGTYFGIVSTGGPYGGYPWTGFCDGAGRWEKSSSGLVAEPTWVNWSGGDSIYTLALSGTGYYVAGHMRWLDNTYGVDDQGPGAYASGPIGVLDVKTGKAIRTWNAMYMDRSHGKEDLTLFPGGMVVGGDGSYLKNKYHRGIGLFPLS